MPDRDVRRDGWRGYMPRPARQLGYRGRTLLVLGVVWCLVGLGVPGENHDPHVWVHTWPDWTRVVMWDGAGLTALAVAWRPRGFGDAVGWTLLYVPPAVRAVSYALAWADHVLPFGGPGVDRAWVPALIYGTMAYTVYLLSGWPEPPFQPVRVPARQEAGSREERG